MEKLKKTAKILDVLVRIARGIAIGVAIALAAALVIFIFTAGVKSDGADVSVSPVDSELTFGLGSVRLLMTGFRPASLSTFYRSVIAALLIAVAAMAVTAVEANILHRILSPMREGRPFDASVPSRLRTLGWLSLAETLAISAIEYVAVSIQMRMLNAVDFFNSEYVEGYTVIYRFELGYLLIPVAFFLLSWIFQYGEELQRQSDETL